MTTVSIRFEKKESIAETLRKLTLIPLSPNWVTSQGRGRRTTEEQRAARLFRLSLNTDSSVPEPTTRQLPGMRTQALHR